MLAAVQIHVYPAKSIPKDWKSKKMIVEGPKTFSPVYSAWFGRTVVMRVVIRQCHVPMSCRIVSESAVDVRVRVHPGWEMDVQKNLILGVEEVVLAMEGRMN